MRARFQTQTTTIYCHKFERQILVENPLLLFKSNKTNCIVYIVWRKYLAFDARWKPLRYFKCGVYIVQLDKLKISLKSTYHFTNMFPAIFNCFPLCPPSSPQPFSVWGGSVEEPEERRPASPEYEIFWWKHGIFLWKHYLSVEYFDENISLAMKVLTKTLPDEYQIFW